MNRTKSKWLNVISVITSIIAICISVYSCVISKKSLEYDINRNTMIDTPALNEFIDSTYISFSLNGNNTTLQGLCIYFPTEVEMSPYNINFKPFCINRNYLEKIVENYLYKNLSAQDSIISLGTFALPVMIDYSSVVYGFPQELRENRAFIFTFIMENNLISAHFSHAYLVQRCGYPLKRHWFYNGPFSSSLEEKVKNQDRLDMQELLQKQLTLMNKCLHE